MKKLVKESLFELFSDGKISSLTPEEKHKIDMFISKYDGEFDDEDIHDLADQMGLDKSDVEEYIYSIAREKFNDLSGESDLHDNSEINPNVKGFHNDMEGDTIKNDSFRKVIYTGKHMQLVLMSLKPGENIGMEHHYSDQFFRFDKGRGKAIINGNEYDIKDGDSIFVPGGAEHDIINTSDSEDLKMYTLYGPPNHKEGIEKRTKEEAEKAEESGEDKFDGRTSE